MTVDLGLVHYSAAAVTTVRSVEQVRGTSLEQFARHYGEPFLKPRGLWLSCDAFANNWREWCIAENFCVETLTHVHDVTLRPDAAILRLRNAADIDAFAARFGDALFPDGAREYIRWVDVAAAYQGIIIAPYVWDRRLNGGIWYYGWDCASGCVWDAAAIARIELREIKPIEEAAE